VLRVSSDPMKALQRGFLPYSGKKPFTKGAAAVYGTVYRM
jgi:hypothetical protein